MKKVVLGFVCGCFILAIFLAAGVYRDVAERKQIKEDHAEINRVNYELFNIQLWKDEALGIFQKKITEFQISENAYESLGEQIELYLGRLYVQYFESGELLNTILDQLEKNGTVNSLFLNMIRTNVMDQLDDLNLDAQIPGLTDQLLAEIKTNEPMLKGFLQQEILRLLLDDASSRIFDRRRLIYQKYDLVDLDETDTFLESEINVRSASISKQLGWLIALLTLIGLITISTRKIIGFNPMISSLTALSILLLVLGISMPMIDIDARLNSFSFSLMNEPINFDEQVIYFQSKSILEVTQTLWTAGGIDLKLVGLLVLLFSIVFPFFKLILSALYLFVEKIRRSPLAQNIIFHLGKWSMADVFVVAMFMAYIGLYGLIASQLSSISNNQSGFAVETVNYSKLSPGAFFFTAYTLLSIFIGILINRKSLQQKA